MAKTKTSLTLSKKNTTARENNKHARRNFFKRVLDIMAKTKPSKKTPPQSIGRLLWLLLRNTYITYLKLLIKLEGKDSINLEIESMIDGFQHPARKWFSKKWNFFTGDFSLKRIYRNSEGHIIPLLGGVLALAVFYSINAWLFTHTTENNENRGIALWSLGIFIVFLLVAWFVIYQLKKTNLRNDVASELARIFIRHFSPYPHLDMSRPTRTEIKGMEIENRNFYVVINFGLKVENQIKRYLAYKNLNFVFNKEERYSINSEVKKNIINSIYEKLNEILLGDKIEIEKKIPLTFKNIIHFNERGYFFFVKEGNPENPKNSKFFEIDIEEKNPSFVIFENLKPKIKNKFFDVNTQKIIQAQYKEGKVTLTIAQSNTAATQEITVSLSEWLTNRNNLC